IGDLQVVAEDLVVADLHALDAGGLLLARFEAGDVLAVGAERGAQFVQLRAVAGADRLAVAQIGGRVVTDGALDLGGHVVTGRGRGDDLRQVWRVERLDDGRDALQRVAQPRHFARTGLAVDDAV